MEDLACGIFPPYRFTHQPAHAAARAPPAGAAPPPHTDKLLVGDKPHRHPNAEPEACVGSPENVLGRRTSYMLRP